MEHRNNQHPDADQGSGQQQPDPPVPNPIVPNVPQPILQPVVPVLLIAEYQYTVVFSYGSGSGYYYYHYYHCYPCMALPNGGVVFSLTFHGPVLPIRIVNDPNHHDPPRLEPLPEEVTLFFIPLASSPVLPIQIVNGPNIIHHDPPRLEPLPEDEVVAPEIPGHDEVDEVADQLHVLTFDMLNYSNSYEELLALAELMGNVSVGLSSEFIERNLNVRTFESIPTREECVICLDEFEAGENIGTLECGHEYHKHCIKRWLRDHNTCPLCMSPALRVD